MIAILALVAVVIVVIGLLFWAIRGSAPRTTGPENLEAQLRPVDLPAFLNLTDTSETDYLQHALPPSRFRRVQRVRILAMFRYLDALSHNSAILIRMGDLASRSSDPQVAESGRALSDTALHTRLLVLRAYLTLVPRLIYPMPKGAWRPGVITDYEQLKRCFLHLASVQAPVETSRTAGLL